MYEYRVKKCIQNGYKFNGSRYVPTYAEIKDLGILNIEQIRELAKEYIGDVFKDNENIEQDIQYIKEKGNELWLTNEEVNGTMVEIHIE